LRSSRLPDRRIDDFRTVVDGKANSALCAFVARAAGVPSSRVSVVRGQTSRDKVVRVDGVDDAFLKLALLRQITD